MPCDTEREYELEQQRERDRERELKKKARKTKSKKIVFEQSKKQGWTITQQSEWKYTASKPYSTDKMEIEILDSGTVRITTGKISAVNHVSAENFHRNIQQQMGGKMTSRSKPGAIAHSHEGHLHVH